MARQKENHENEKSALKKEHARVLLENAREFQMKLNAVCSFLVAGHDLLLPTASSSNRVSKGSSR